MDNAWADLSAAQREALERLMSWGGDALLIDEEKWRELEALGLVEIRSLFVKVTPKGRAVFEAGNPQADAGAAFDPYDYSVMTAAELLDVAREAWQKYDLKEVVDEYADMGASVMMDLAMNATPATDELATLRAQLAEAQAERDAALAAMHTLQDARNDFAARLMKIDRYALNLYLTSSVEYRVAFLAIREMVSAADAGSEGG